MALAEARAKADGNRKHLERGQDPIAEGRKVGTEMTFAQCSSAYMQANQTGWKNAKHRQQWENTLKSYADPVIGGLPVSCIDVGLVMRIIEPIWATKTETASRVRGRIETVLDWAAARGYRSSENPARWKGHIDKLLPAQRKIARVRHHPALPFVQIPAFLPELRGRGGVGALALEFTILTAARTGETIGCEWSEIDLAAKIWTVPGDRMKAGSIHRIPLCQRALEILEGQACDGEFVFSLDRKRPISNMTMAAVLDRMGRGDLTVHGFRSTFRDWAAEITDFPNEMVEMALAHTIQNKAEAAYRRGDLLERRRVMMDAWAAYCDGAAQVTAQVLTLDRKKAAGPG